MNQKEKWIQETLNSLAGIKRADANDQLYDNVMARLQKERAKIIFIQPKVVWRVAASIALLIGLNVFVLAKSSRSDSPSAFAQEYFSYINQI